MSFISKNSKVLFFLLICLFTQASSQINFASHNFKNQEITEKQIQKILKERRVFFLEEQQKYEKLFSAGLISQKELLRARSSLEDIDSLEELFDGSLKIQKVQAIKDRYLGNLEKKEENLEKTKELLEQGLISRKYYQELERETEFSREILSFVNTYKIFNYYSLELKDLRLDYQNLFNQRYRISSHFGFRKSPFGGKFREFHAGIDFACPVGAQIKSILPGKVVKVVNSTLSGGGRKVYIQHSQNLTSVYMHLSKIQAKLGQRVKTGESVALCGNSGTRVTGPHLHFELRHKKISINPKPYFKNL